MCTKAFSTKLTQMGLLADEITGMTAAFAAHSTHILPIITITDK
jgi:hypothetical protein